MTKGGEKTANAHDERGVVVATEGERVLLLADADGGHHAACGAFFAEAEEEIAAARGAKSR